MKFSQVGSRPSNIQKRLIEIRNINKRARKVSQDLAKQGAKIISRNSTKYLRRRTGRLAESFTAVVKPEKSKVTILIKSSVPYALIHNEGGTIRPKRARVLTIPVTSQARNSKGPRSFGTQLQSVPWGLIDKAGRTQFVYSASVYIPGTGYITKSVEDIRKYLGKINKDLLRGR